MPTPVSRFWADLTTLDFASLDAAATVAVLPLGATEQHGPHLPLDVDAAIVDGIVQACLPQVPARLPVLVLPTQRVGYSPEHAAYGGTLTHSWEQVLHSWIELGEGVARAGVKKLLLLNAHGGQASLLDIAARELRQRCGLIVYGCNWWNLPLGAAGAAFSEDEHRFGVHGGAIETSIMLALDASRVRMGLAQDFGSASRDRAASYDLLGNGRTAKLGWMIEDYNPEGAAGNAAAATQEKGRALLDAAGRQLALLLEELSRLPLSTLRSG